MLFKKRRGVFVYRSGAVFFEIEAHDESDLIARGKHERFVIDKAKFDGKLKDKIENTGK